MTAKKPISEHKKNGRPSKFETVKDIIIKMAKYGLTDKQMADTIDVTEVTLNNWKKKYPDFFNPLKKNKDIADSTVERSLFERASGYSHPDVHISNYQGHITVTDITKHYPPDTTAMIFWLKNRQPARWRDKQEIDHTITNKYEDMTDAELKALYNKMQGVK